MSSSNQLGFPALLAYGLVFMIPLAPVSIFGFVYADSQGLVPLVYLLGAVAMLFTAQSYRVMSQTFPEGGSVYTYVGRTLGPQFGFITGWIVLMDYILIPGLVYKLSAFWVQDFLPQLPMPVWIIALAASIAYLNGRGILVTTRLSFLLLALQLITIIVFTICALITIATQPDHYIYWQPLGLGSDIHLSFIGTALSLALLNYLGFDGISTLALETKRPEKNIGRAIMAAVILIACIFVFQTYIASLIAQQVPYKTETAYFDLAYAVGGTWLYGLFMVMNIVSIGFASALVTQAASARLLYAMAQHQAVPFARLLVKQSTRQMPIAAIWLCAVLSMLAALCLSEDILLHAVSFGGLTAYVLLNFALVWHFGIRRQENLNMMLTYVYPLLGIGFIGFVWVHFSAVVLLLGCLYIAFGVSIYQRLKRSIEI